MKSTIKSLYRITGSFLNAATSILKRVTGRIFKVGKYFHSSKPKYYLLFSPARQQQDVKTIGIDTVQKVLI
jgi:hypothetical protein